MKKTLLLGVLVLSWCVPGFGQDPLLVAEKAKAGDTDAMVTLGGMFYGGGEQIKQNWRKAAMWYRKAALLGHPQGQFNLGTLYEKGKGVPRNNALAAQWYRKSGNQGNRDAQYRLAGMYESGRGVPKSATKALHWYGKAAEQNHPLAQYKMGLMYETGSGVAKDEKRAAELYRVAVEQNSAEAQHRLGLMYEEGRGVPKDAREALKHNRSQTQGGPNSSQRIWIRWPARAPLETRPHPGRLLSAQARAWQNRRPRPRRTFRRCSPPARRVHRHAAAIPENRLAMAAMQLQSLLQLLQGEKWSSGRRSPGC